MATLNLQSYKVASQELSSSTKFNNLVQAIQDALAAGSVTDLAVNGSFTSTGTIASQSGVTGFFVNPVEATGYVLYYSIVADARPRMAIQYDGKLVWGPGGATVPDTNLYRSAADTLKTDDKFIAVGGLGGGYIGAAVSGGQNNKIPWYDNNGTLVGYIPIYAS